MLKADALKMICIYAIINILDDKHYVGQAEDKDYRWREHRKQLRGFYHHNIHLQRAWSKHGEHNFIFVVLEELQRIEKLQDLLNEREAYWARLVNAEYNIAPPGQGMRGYKHTEEARENMSKAHIGYKASDETKKKMSEAHIGNQYAKGKKQSPERIEARARLHRGKPKSEEHKAKIAASNLGKKRSAETRAKQSLAAKNRLPMSEETRKKLSDAAYRQWNG